MMMPTLRAVLAKRATRGLGLLLTAVALLPAATDQEERATKIFKGTLLEKSDIPTLESIVPYREALVVSRYRLDKLSRKAKGGDPAFYGKEVLVAQWGLYGSRPVGLEDLAVGSTVPLELRSLDHFEDLKFVKRSNTLGDDTLALPLFLDVGQHRLMKDPATAEKYGLMTYKMRDLHALRHQLKLVALGDSRAFKGIKPDEFYPEENRKIPVAYNMAYDSTGLRTAMVVMRDYCPQLPRLEWVVHAFSTRAAKVGYRGREHVWGFVDSPGLHLDRVNGFADWQADQSAGPILLADYEWQAGGCYFGKGPGSRGARGICPWGWQPRGGSRLKKAEGRLTFKGGRSKFDEDLLADYEACVRLLGERGVRVLTFIPPQFTDPKESQGDGEDGTSREDYRRLLKIFAAMEKRNPTFFFHDIHAFGDNPYTIEDFVDKDHLNAQGAAKLTAHLEQLRRRHAE